MKLLLFIFSIAFGALHPIKSTTSKLTLKKGANAEFIIRFFKDDFDASFKKIDKDFDAYDGLNEVEKTDVIDYLNKNIQIYVDGVQQQKLVLKKYTTEELTMTFTLETGVIDSFDEIKMTNKVFYDFFAEQQTNNIKFVDYEKKTFNAVCVDTFPAANAKQSWFR